MGTVWQHEAMLTVGRTKAQVCQPLEISQSSLTTAPATR